MIDNVLKHYKYVKTYDQSQDVPQSIIDDLLQRTWKVTPSKNNFMPYKLHVLGPQHQNLKDKVYEKALHHQDSQDHLTTPSLKMPRFHNIVSCHYLLIFTQRAEDQPNAHQRELIALGRNYTQTDPNKLGENYGNALEYLRDEYTALEKLDLRPDYNRIVNFVK